MPRFFPYASRTPLLLEAPDRLEGCTHATIVIAHYCYVILAPLSHAQRRLLRCRQIAQKARASGTCMRPMHAHTAVFATSLDESDDRRSYGRTDGGPSARTQDTRLGFDASKGKWREDDASLHACGRPACAATYAERSSGTGAPRNDLGFRDGLNLLLTEDDWPESRSACS